MYSVCRAILLCLFPLTFTQIALIMALTQKKRPQCDRSVLQVSIIIAFFFIHFDALTQWSELVPYGFSETISHRRKENFSNSLPHSIVQNAFLWLVYTIVKKTKIVLDSANILSQNRWNDRQLPYFRHLINYSLHNNNNKHYMWNAPRVVGWLLPRSIRI